MLFILSSNRKEASRRIKEEIAMRGTLASQNTPLYDSVKRAMDIFLSLIFGLLTFPFWIVIALFIVIDSKGPVLILQERVGKDGKIFLMYKFRTMHQEHDLYAPSPLSGSDKRITPFGSWLRKTSLDELPQLINIFTGDMSLVGPRPEMPFVVNTYNETQRVRLKVTPGLTGLWQVLARKDLPLTENTEFDVYYIYKKGFILDIIILIRTIPAIISGRGAY